jgi:fatty-acyl-CoA synthase
MRGMMMDYPLTLQQFLERNRRLFGAKEIVSRTATGIHRYTYADYHERVCRLAGILSSLCVQPGDRVATFAWNTYRHLEFYYAVPCMGAVLHTVNIRLSPEQIAYIINDAGARVLAVDEQLLPAIESLRTQLSEIEHLIVMRDAPAESQPHLDYEELLLEASPDFEWPEVDESDAAGICYSSGTTGNSKGVVYSHRALYLHAISLATVDSLAIAEADRVMPVVPMFHANAWGLPHASVAVGASQVLPGPSPTPADLLALIQDERVTVAAGVPTVWIGALAEFRKHPYDLSSLRCVPCGGSAAPESLIAAYEREMGAPILHAWGMTETAPVATVGQIKSTLAGLTDEQRFRLRSRQGLPVLGMDLTILDDEGNELPWDGETMGEIVVRGPWVIAEYLHVEAPERFNDGWFRTGDVATIDPEGYVQIVDRTKDLVKSGGEWISSVEIEGAIMGHPDVLEAAVIAVPHEKWGERPLAVVVLGPGSQTTAEDILDFIRPRVARFAMPDEVRFVDEIPKTSVGKFDKKILRRHYAETSAVLTE